MANKFTKHFSLTQHTPMIHFQADQRGATLRATDLKPKIDRYIWESVKRSHQELYEKYKDFIHSDYIPKPGGDKKTASAYRIHISGKPKSYYVPTTYVKGRDRDRLENGVNNYFKLPGQRIKLLDGSPYFANTDKLSKEKWSEVRLAVMYENIVVEIFSPHKGLSEFIGEVLPYVLFRNNFGTRSSKGFGHFTVEGSSSLLKEKTSYFFSLKVDDRNELQSFKKLFERIDTIYKTLRSGINLPIPGNEFYFKSLLFKYFHQQDIQWDKKSVKEYFYQGDLERQKRNQPQQQENPVHFESRDKYLVRDLLGLATSQDWLKPYQDNISKASSPDKKLIERFASPIWFKPVRSKDKRYFDVFIGADSLPTQIFDQTFDINSKKSNKDSLQLNTPPSFDIHDYLEYAFEKVDIDEHVANRFHDHRKYGDIERMYDSIRKNLA